ncbi:hypothetical protein [Steroidobacter cummioxidans]|uniref:hypothetical protein n=1 Tax=Steroidobacter cummioxidans TaxID=1803913 RepID=UPI00128FE6BC|nr:hypothetical protein [Steroidobacter cummioxidans]
MARSDPPPRAFSRLRYRPVARRDVAECFELLPPWLGMDQQQIADAMQVWDTLVDEPSLYSGLIEDLAQPAGKRIQAWGVTLIVPQSLVRQLALDGQPQAFMTRRVYGALRDASFKPMTDREIGIENARGELTMMILHFSQRDHDISQPYVQDVIAMANDTFRTFHDGFNLRAVYYETGEINDLVAVASGFIRRQYANSEELQTLPREHQPAFFGLTREQARNLLPGSPARNCFQNQPPLFTFSASQRRLLWFALFDDSDDALMPLLDVSVHGLKKLWRGIYERIEDRMPEFFGDAAGGDEGKRGPEKRRQVLAYVRQRPEELRPWSSAD